MEVTGKIIQKLELQSGTSKAGNAWSKQEYVLETIENFPKKVHFDFFGERANQYPLEVGDTITLSFDIESREWNGRWFTSIRGWKAEKDDASAPVNAGYPIDNSMPTPPPTVNEASISAIEGAENDDLPF